MKKLSARLRAVADRIDHRRHADIGSDHGLLLRYLLVTGKIDFGLAVEINQQPYNHSVAALDRLNAVVVMADGLAGLKNHDVDGVSVCGVGGRLAASIVLDADVRIDKVILQPNDHLRHVRRRMHDGGYHLLNEIQTDGSRRFSVLVFEHHPGVPDPSYDESLLDAQHELGPRHWKRLEPTGRVEFENERRYWRQFPALTDQARRRAEAIETLLGK